MDHIYKTVYLIYILSLLVGRHTYTYIYNYLHAVHPLKANTKYKKVAAAVPNTNNTLEAMYQQTITFPKQT